MMYCDSILGKGRHIVQGLIVGKNSVPKKVDQYVMEYYLLKWVALNVITF